MRNAARRTMDSMATAMWRHNTEETTMAQTLHARLTARQAQTMVKQYSALKVRVLTDDAQSIIHEFNLRMSGDRADGNQWTSNGATVVRSVTFGPVVTTTVLRFGSGLELVIRREANGRATYTMRVDRDVCENCGNKPWTVFNEVLRALGGGHVFGVKSFGLRQSF